MPEAFPPPESKESRDRLRNRANQLRHNYLEEQGEFLTREQRHQLRDSGKKEDLDRLEKYEKSKFRNNYFAGVFYFFDLVNKEDFDFKNKAKILKDKKELFQDFKKLETGSGNPITKEMVERANTLLDEILENF